MKRYQKHLENASKPCQKSTLARRWRKCTFCTGETWVYIFLHRRKIIFAHFCMILVHISPRKQDTEQQKRTRFDAFWDVGRWRVSFAIARPEYIFFVLNFLPIIPPFDEHFDGMLRRIFFVFILSITFQGLIL